MTFFPLLPFVWLCCAFPRVTNRIKLLSQLQRDGVSTADHSCPGRNVNCGWLSIRPGVACVGAGLAGLDVFFCSFYVFQAWRRYDTDRSGYIEANELKVWCRTCLNRPTLHNISKSPTSFIHLTHVYSHFSFLPSFIPIQMHIDTNSDRVTKQSLFFFCLLIVVFLFLCYLPIN